MLGLGFALFVSLGGVSRLAPSEPVRTVTLAWDASSDPRLIGYRLDGGTSPGVYYLTREVGRVTSVTVDLPPDQAIWYFTLSARGEDITASGARVLLESYRTAPVRSDTTTSPCIGCQPPPPPPPPPDPRCLSPFGDRVVSIFITKWEPTTGSPGSMARINFQLASPNSPIVLLKVLLNGIPDTPVATIITQSSPDGDLRSSGGIWFQTPVTPGSYTIAVQATNAYGCTAVQGKNALGQALTVVVQ
jgi:hypothetical protein